MDSRRTGEEESIENLDDYAPRSFESEAPSSIGLGSMTIGGERRSLLADKVTEPFRKGGVKETLKWGCGLCCLFSCLFITLLILLLCLVFYFVFQYPVSHYKKCTSDCQYSIVESIPTEMTITYLNSLPSNEVILYLLGNAKKSVKTLQYYFELENDAVPSARGDYGNEVFDMYKSTAERGVEVEIIYNKATSDFGEELGELDKLEKVGVKVYSMDFEKYFGGVLHTKMIVVDDESFYLGSLNMDWKSFSQVKELGIYVRNCPCLADDVTKIFEVYRWYMKDEQVDENYDTSININKTILVDMEYIDGLEKYNETETTKGHTYFSSSPPGINTKHRTSDLEALLNVINEAEEYIFVEVMDFLPFRIYSDPVEYWGDLVDALKNAMVERNVLIHLLISKWNYSMPEEKTFLQSLNIFGKICENNSSSYTFCSGKMVSREYKIPDAKEFSPQYNYTRVGHSKFVVTEKNVFISTSNWSEDYFFNTAGLSFVSTDKRIRDQLKAIFERDWNSQYSHEIKIVDNDNGKKCDS